MIFCDKYNNININSPLEQFEIISLFSFMDNGFILDLSLLNSSFLFLFNIVLFLLFYHSFWANINLLPSSIHSVLIEYSYSIICNILVTNAGKENQKFFPIVYNLAFILFICNFFGMIPFGFTLTSHIVITFFLSFSIFFGINLVGIMNHKLRFMGLFLPAGTPFIIMPFLFLIEVLSYISRVLSLAIRLFANMMSGHTLLKILATFLFGSFAIGGIFIFVNIVPIIALHIIIFMELCISLLQVYVFIVLSCIYLHDLTNPNH